MTESEIKLIIPSDSYNTKCPNCGSEVAKIAEASSDLIPPIICSNCGHLTKRNKENITNNKS